MGQVNSITTDCRTEGIKLSPENSTINFDSSGNVTKFEAIGNHQFNGNPAIAGKGVIIDS